VPVVPLPDDPDFEQLRKLAKDLRDEVRAGVATALAEVAEHHPDGAPDTGDRASFSLHAAQLVIARRYGFASWPRLKRHLELVARYGRAPDRVAPSTNVADEFLRLGSLNYGDDGPDRWRRARELLAEHPDIRHASIHCAASVSDAATVQRFLDEDSSRARQLGGPFAWEPLFYLAYARHDPDVALDAVLTTARVLLAAGADPNAGYLWHGLPTPFTVLTGAFGEGEQGPQRQPPHAHSLALARVLLDAGADANDGQALYNRMFEQGNEHLELLFEYGLGRGDGGPWHALLGDQLDSPRDLLRSQLRWAVVHDMLDRARLLAGHGTDVVAPFPDGPTAVEIAATCGNEAVVEYLVGAGAATPRLAPADALVAAALRVDRDEVERLRIASPGAVDAARAARPGVIVQAAAQGRPDAVTLLAELGFDVNARSRADVPVEQEWETALHVAAGDGNVELARRLLALGADPTVHDHRFDATPLGWARHFERDEVIELLAPLTPDDG
jgi:hypothetical protein